MPNRLRLSTAAERDIADILDHTEVSFGRDAADRYLTLIKAALADLLEDREPPGSRAAVELDPTARIYHIRHSRSRTPAHERVRTPRHFVLYKVLMQDVIGVARILHDAMDLPSQVADDYGS